MLQFIVLKELYFFILLWTLNTIPLFSVYICKLVVLYYYVLLPLAVLFVIRHWRGIYPSWVRYERDSGDGVEGGLQRSNRDCKFIPVRCIMGFVCMNVRSHTSLIPQSTHETGYQKLTLMGGIFLMRDTYTYTYNIYTWHDEGTILFYVIICNLFEIYREILRRRRHFKRLYTEQSSVGLHKKTIKFAVNMTFKCVLCCVCMYL